MLKKLKTYFLEGNLFCGIEVTQGTNGTGYIAILIRRKKNQLVVEATETFNDLLSVKAFIPKNTPVFVCINTDKVLIKDVQSSDNKSALVNKVFPNINPDNFYYELITTKNRSLVSVCRKEVADAVINDIEKESISVCGFSIGISAITPVIPHLNTDHIALSSYVIALEDTEIQSLTKINTENHRVFSLNGMELKSCYLLAFGGLLLYVLKSHNSFANFSDQNIAYAKEVSQKRFFGSFLKVGITLLLLSLLINFAVFSYYFDKAENLKQTVQVNEENKTRFLTLDSVVAGKQKMVEDILASSSSKSSFYIDKLIQTLPQSILLQQLTYHPLEKRVKEGQEIVVNRNQILITGVSGNSEAFSKWIEAIEAFKWVQKVSVSHFGTNNSSAGSDFILNVFVYEQ